MEILFTTLNSIPTMIVIFILDTFFLLRISKFRHAVSFRLIPTSPNLNFPTSQFVDKYFDFVIKLKNIFNHQQKKKKYVYLVLKSAPDAVTIMYL